VDGPQAGFHADAERGFAYSRPVLRGVLHQIALGLSLVAAPLLVRAAEGLMAKIAAAVYAVSVAALFTASALYHRVSWSEAVERRMQRLDHAAIFVSIAGAYTPLLLLRLPRPYTLVGMYVIWGMALIGLVWHMLWLDAPERLVGAVYLGLGWSGLPVLLLLVGRMAPAGLGLIALGGALCTVGAVSFHHRWPDPVPDKFGFHEVFHALVCLGVACQYSAVAFFVL